MKNNKGGFTLPGESGYEKLTIELAERWGADVIRDSDGTTLSDEILDAGYGIYSTICPIRNHNAWIEKHLHAQQQSFLCSAAKVATENTLVIDPIEGFFAEQFTVNDSEEAMAFWQVYDRTAGELLSRDKWTYDPSGQTVRISTTPFHRYTVSFLAYRIWEEISMYNHVTNDWSSEHLRQLNPYDPGARKYLLDWFNTWCDEHSNTTVVRFTSLFYNFAWIWGSNPENRSVFTDWASYDFTVCPEALNDFEKAYGYALTAEDFVRGGKYNATHCPPSQSKRDWMAFIGAFVRDIGKACVDIVHRAGKKAYVFYDDSWVGIEPYNGHFEEFGFDGMIKCVFSGYEVRLCAGVPVKTHEIRFHPYLFPVGLGGMPTFSEGGTPGKDAMNYWVHVRRALLRSRIERAGLGGYLHLVEQHPDFVDAMDEILAQFRTIDALHEAGEPAVQKPRIGILHSWGALRTWTLSGHFHETYQHVLIHILESLSGMPFSVRFLSFDDVKRSVLKDIDVLINAGEAGSAWSGGDAWKDADLVTALTKWVYEGGVFLGVDAPSAAKGGDHFLRMAHVLGVDIDTGAYCCHGRWPVCETSVKGLIPAGVNLPARENVFLLDGETKVLLAEGGKAQITQKSFGKGNGFYLSGYNFTMENTKLFSNLLSYMAEGLSDPQGNMSNPFVETAVFPAAGKMVVINNADTPQNAPVSLAGVNRDVALPAYGMEVLDINE